MIKVYLWAVVSTCCAVFVLPHSASAAYVTIGEAGDTRSSATNVDSYFDRSFDNDIFNSTTIDHVSIKGTNDAASDVDWYSFTGTGGKSLELDVDCAANCGAAAFADAFIALFDASGTLLAVSDDSFPADPGSDSSGFDPFIGTMTLPGSGIYYAAVSTGDTVPDAMYTGTLSAFKMLRPDGVASGGRAASNVTAGLDTYSSNGTASGGDYILHISTVAAVPVPAAVWLFISGLIGLAGVSRREKGS